MFKGIQALEVVLHFCNISFHHLRLLIFSCQKRLVPQTSKQITLD